MNKVQKILDHVEQHCRDHGVRLTNKRKQVLSGLLYSDKALSAYELSDFCKSKFGESIPAMSVYRILDFLKEEHLVHKLNLSNKYIACTHITCSHEHGVPQFLICGQCHKVEEIQVSQSALVELQNSVTKAGFQLESPQLEMDCICDACASRAELSNKHSIN